MCVGQTLDAHFAGGVTHIVTSAIRVGGTIRAAHTFRTGKALRAGAGIVASKFATAAFIALHAFATRIIILARNCLHPDVGAIGIGANPVRSANAFLAGGLVGAFAFEAHLCLLNRIIVGAISIFEALFLAELGLVFADLFANKACATIGIGGARHAGGAVGCRDASMNRHVAFWFCSIGAVCIGKTCHAVTRHWIAFAATRAVTTGVAFAATTVIALQVSRAILLLGTNVGSGTFVLCTNLAAKAIAIFQAFDAESLGGFTELASRAVFVSFAFFEATIVLHVAFEHFRTIAHACALHFAAVATIRRADVFSGAIRRKVGVQTAFRAVFTEGTKGPHIVAGYQVTSAGSCGK